MSLYIPECRRFAIFALLVSGKPDVLNPVDRGRQQKSAKIEGFIAEVKIVIFTPTYQTTQEPQTEIEALSNCAAHPHETKDKIFQTFNRTKIVVILVFLAMLEAYTSKGGGY